MTRDGLSDGFQPSFHLCCDAAISAAAAAAMLALMGQLPGRPSDARRPFD